MVDVVLCDRCVVLASLRQIPQKSLTAKAPRDRNSWVEGILCSTKPLQQNQAKTSPPPRYYHVGEGIQGWGHGNDIQSQMSDYLPPAPSHSWHACRDCALA